MPVRRARSGISALGDEAVATGALRLALERAAEDLFPDGLPIGSLPPG